MAQPALVALALVSVLLLAAGVSGDRAAQPPDYEETRFPLADVVSEQTRELDRGNFLMAQEERKPVYHHAPMEGVPHLPRSIHEGLYGSMGPSAPADAGQSDGVFTEAAAQAYRTPAGAQPLGAYDGGDGGDEDENQFGGPDPDVPLRSAQAVPRYPRYSDGYGGRNPYMDQQQQQRADPIELETSASARADDLAVNRRRQGRPGLPYLSPVRGFSHAAAAAAAPPPPATATAASGANDALFSQVAQAFLQTALRHIDLEMGELEQISGQEVVGTHHKRTRAHRTTRRMPRSKAAAAQGASMLEESESLTHAEGSDSAGGSSKSAAAAAPTEKKAQPVIERLQLMTLPKDMKLPVPETDNYLPAIPAPTETIELEIDPVVKAVNKRKRRRNSDSEDSDSSPQSSELDDLPSDSQPSSVPSAASRRSIAKKTASSHTASKQRAESGTGDGDGGEHDDSGDDDDDDDDDDDNGDDDDGDGDDDDGGDSDGSQKKRSRRLKSNQSLFGDDRFASRKANHRDGGGNGDGDDDRLFHDEPKAPKSSQRHRHRKDRVPFNQREPSFDSFLQASTQARARAAARVRRGFLGSVVSGVSSAIGGLFGGGSKPAGGGAAATGSGMRGGASGKGSGKTTPQDIEDCTACKLVWSQVEMDVGNARYVEDVQASFEHNCMDAQKSTIFYEACEDMYDDMYAITDDYMSNQFPVPAMCARAKMCSG